MRAGPIDLTPFGALLTGIGWLYWLLAAAGLWWALRGARTWKTKLLRAVPVVLLFGIGPGFIAWQGLRSKLNLDASMALFAERCKTAGERIAQTVDNVDGVVWMKWREKTSNADNYADQWKLNDPYGQDCGLEGCILQLLRATEGVALASPETTRRQALRFKFVETTDPRDRQRYRYTAAIRSVSQTPHEVFVRHVEATGSGAESDGHFVALERKPIAQFDARYGIAWDDISTREDRQHWIAGSSLKVIDLQANEVIAERVGYMIDRGQGSQAGFRSPWLYAAYTACPAFDQSESKSPIKTSRSRAFVFKVLRTSLGE